MESEESVKGAAPRCGFLVPHGARPRRDWPTHRLSSDTDTLFALPPQLVDFPCNFQLKVVGARQVHTCNSSLSPPEPPLTPLPDPVE